MEKQLISKEESQVRVANTHGNQKLKYYRDALEYCSQYVTIRSTDYKEFQSSFTEFTAKQLRKKAGAFATDWNNYRLFDFFDLNATILSEIEKRFKQHPQIQLTEDGTSFIVPDFSVYCTTEDELKRFKTLQKLIEAVDEIRDSRHPVNYSLLATALNGAIVGTHNNAKPSAHFIKQGKR